MQSLHSQFMRVAVVGLSLSLAASSVLAATVWDESVNGDLSNNGNAPTPINLLAGSNTVIATMPGSDLDFLTINVPAGHQFTALTNLTYASSDAISFIGVRSGTIIPNIQNAALLLGYTHFGTATVGDDILPAIGTGEGSIGFTPPLPSGAYSYWIQQANIVDVSYSFDFVVTTLPSEELMGDYNGNDVLDAADYTVWRDTMTAGGTSLLNDPTPGIVDESDFEYWRDNFGATLGSGAGSASAVPEPATAWLACLAAVGLMFTRGRSRQPAPAQRC